MAEDKRGLKDILRVEGINAQGFGIIPKLVMRDRRLTRDAKAIYAYFKSYAGAGTTAFPSVKLICYDLNFGSEDTFRKHMKQLVKYGYIKIVQERAKANDIDKDGKKLKPGTFKRNIYTLIEKPEYIEITEVKPTPKNNGTEDLPTLSFRGTDASSTENRVYNNNSIKNNSFINNQSVLEYSQTDIENRYNTIIKKAEIDLYKEDSRNLLQNAIKNLLQFKELKIKNVTFNQKQIHDQLLKLNINICDYALNKFRQVQDEREIKNKFNYFMILLLNSIEEYSANNIF